MVTRLQARNQEQFNTSSETTIDQRDGSRAGSPDSEIVSYDSEHSDTNDQEEREKRGKPRTTRQKKDWRPKSTFWQKPYMQMSTSEKLCHLATLSPEVHELKEESLDRGPVPTKSVIPENLFILAIACTPLALQSLAYQYYPGKSFSTSQNMPQGPPNAYTFFCTEYRWPMKVAFPFYLLSFIGMALAVVQRLDAACVKYGTFDEKQIGRDRTPDQETFALAKGITCTSTSNIHENVAPADMRIL